MKVTELGALEELVLLTAASIGEKAYAVQIKEEVERQSGQSFNISSIHTTLFRLEEKKFLRSEMGGATAERGGRRKRYFSLTAEGIAALAQVRELRNRLWNLIPDTLTKQ
ncbi:MAG: helix-turn-helix transcriptional regulator [Balneolales bacterium]|nr:helix-turn-helix transcriptional regulator [Balneolales bacterium]